MATIADCLSSLDMSLETLGACNGLHEEWATLKKGYFKAALANHPDKGGDEDKFRKVQAAFETLRALFDGACVASFVASASKCVDEQANLSSSSVPSWDFYADAAADPVPIYRVERAKSARSKCAAKGGAKKCDDGACIAKDALRVGWLNAETGSYGNWVHLGCWRVPSKVWLGLPDPDECSDTGVFMAALLAMSSVVLSGVSELSVDDASAFTSHCMQKTAWARLVKRKDAPNDPPAPPEPEAPAAIADAPSVTTSVHVVAAASSAAASSLGEVSVKQSASTALLPVDKRSFVVPIPGQHGPANSLVGKTFVLTGVFPEVAGGAGLEQGKTRVKAMVESFGGKVTGSISGRTDVLIVGKEPGASKVGKARSNGSCTLLSLHDMRQGLVLGSLEAVCNGKEPMVIQNFSAGFRGNGIGYAIKGPPPKASKAAAKAPAALPAPKLNPPAAKAAGPLVPAPPGDGKVEASSADENKSPPSAPKRVAKAKPAAKAKDNKSPPSAPKRVAKAKPAAKAKDKEAAANKRKATAELWLAVEPPTAIKKVRGPPKDRFSS